MPWIQVEIEWDSPDLNFCLHPADIAQALSEKHKDAHFKVDLVMAEEL